MAETYEWTISKAYGIGDAFVAMGYACAVVEILEMKPDYNVARVVASGPMPDTTPNPLRFDGKFGRRER